MKNAPNDPAVLGPVERQVRPDAEALRLAAAIDPLRRKNAPDHLTVGCAARMLEAQAAEIERLREHAVILAETARQVERERCAVELEARARSWNGLVCSAMLTAAQAMRNGA